MHRALDGGVGSFEHLRAVVASSNVPNVVNLLMWVILLVVFRAAVFRREFVDTTFVGYQVGLVFLIFLVQTIVSIWGFVILLLGLSQVQKFSIWKAVLNVVIPTAIVFGIIWGASFIIWGSGSIK